MVFFPFFFLPAEVFHHFLQHRWSMLQLMKFSKQTWLNLSSKMWKQREKEMRKGSPVSMLFSFCGFPRGCLLEDFHVLKCFPEYLVSWQAAVNRTLFAPAGYLWDESSCASFVGRMQTWGLEPRTDCGGWLSGKGRVLLFPKRINDCVHWASWTELVQNFYFSSLVISLEWNWFSSYLKLITFYIFEVPFSLW